jgi:hypothetical protein
MREVRLQTSLHSLARLGFHWLIFTKLMSFIQHYVDYSALFITMLSRNIQISFLHSFISSVQYDCDCPDFHEAYDCLTAFIIKFHKEFNEIPKECIGVCTGSQTYREADERSGGRIGRRWTEVSRKGFLCFLVNKS